MRTPGVGVHRQSGILTHGTQACESGERRQRSDASRRLVVVVAFDVVNFSALVEADEERVLAAWRALRRRSIR